VWSTYRHPLPERVYDDSWNAGLITNKNAQFWLLHPYTHIHASGHLNYDEIRDVVETVQPKVLIPVHTQQAEVFQTLHDNVILPEKGVAINI